MDYFNDVLTPFLGLGNCSCIVDYAGSESYKIIKNILTCVLKMNKGLTSFEQNEGE